MKTRRHGAIIRLIRKTRVASQEQLRDMLTGEGFDVTQATLSRDMRDLGLAKVSDPQGGAFYTVPSDRESPSPALHQILPALLVSIDGVGPLMVIHTPAGSAEALGGALDAVGWNDILGTIAGDDTLLVITRSEKARREVSARLEEMTS